MRAQEDNNQVAHLGCVGNTECVAGSKGSTNACLRTGEKASKQQPLTGVPHAQYLSCRNIREGT